MTPMDNNANDSAGRQHMFVSYAGGERAVRKAAFERSVLQLLSMSAEGYVATLNANRVMDAFQARAASSGDDPTEDEHDSLDAAETAGVDKIAPQGDDLLSLLDVRLKSAACAPEFTQATNTLLGAHNAEALAEGQEIVEIAAQRPSRGIWQLVSGKAGSGKTTLLLNLAIMALRRGDMNVTVIDLGTSASTRGTTENAHTGRPGADLVLIDNAHCSPPASHKREWWADFQRQIPKSACVLVAVAPEAMADASDPWRQCSGAWRDTSIGAFDCDFRRRLIERLSRRQMAEHGGTGMTDAAVSRLAEELWGNGWQLAEAVDACRSYANVMAREPTPGEIDEIAFNIVGAGAQNAASLEAIRRTIERRIERTCDLEHVGLPACKAVSNKTSQRDMVLYLIKTISGGSLDVIGQQLDLGRQSAVQSMLRTERSLQNDHDAQRFIDATLLGLRTSRSTR